MDRPNSQPDPDQAGASPEIGRAEIAYLFQSGSVTRVLAEAIDALATGGIEEFKEEDERATGTILEPAKTYRALQINLSPELQTIRGFYLIMDDVAIELAQIDRDGRLPTGRWKRHLWVRAMARKIRATLKKFLADRSSTKEGEENADD